MAGACVFGGASGRPPEPGDTSGMAEREQGPPAALPHEGGDPFARPPVCGERGAGARRRAGGGDQSG
eukprot:3718912-Lingulodinium_polyedra.AAC.1